MSEAEVLEQLTAIFREVFDDDHLVLRPETTADEVEGWDSFTHLNLIIAVESHFQIRMRPDEVEALRNVGDLVRIVAARVAKAGAS